MTFRNIRTHDNLTQPYLYVQAFIPSGLPPKVVITPGIDTLYKGANSYCGLKRTTLYNKGGTFHPGHFKVRPIIHYSIASESAGSDVTKMKGIYRNITYTSRIIRGNVASMAINAQGTYLGLLAENPADAWMLQTAIAKSREPEALLGVTLGEAKETFAMFQNYHPRLRKFVKKFNPPGWLGRGKRTFDWASSKWLELRYGWLPFLSEVDTYRTIMNESLVRETSLLKDRTGFGSPVKQVIPFSRSVPGVGYAFGAEVLEIRQSILATVYTQQAINSASVLGVRLSDIPTTLYELVPYSFVLDWFLDVGTWLRASVPIPGLTDLGNVLSYHNHSKRTAVVDSVCLNATPGGNYPATRCQQSYTQTVDTYNRLCNLPIPNRPEFKFGIDSFKRTLDAATLSWQRLSNALPKRR